MGTKGIYQTDSEGKDIVDRLVEAGHPKRPELSKAKIGKGTLSAHLFAVAALVASIGQLVHGGDDTVTHVVTRDDNITQQAYEEIRSHAEKQDEQVKQLSEDMVAMRNFMAGFLQALKSPTASRPKPAASVEKLLPPVRTAEPRPAPLPAYHDIAQKAGGLGPPEVRTSKE
jgi:hypothetical protein